MANIGKLLREALNHESTYNDVLNASIGTVLSDSDIYVYCQKLHRNEEDFWEGDIGERLEKFNSYKLVEIPIEKIETGEYELDPDVEEEYIEKYKSIGSYPPIVLGYFSFGTYNIIDGNHRANALKSAGLKTIKSWVGMKGNIKEEEDTYSVSKGVKPYIERKEEFFFSIHSFNDITDDMIPTIIDYCGWEGHNDEEEAAEDLANKINDYKKMSDPVTLYRIVGVKNKRMINTKDMGSHFVLGKWVIDDVFLDRIGFEDNSPDGAIPYIIEVRAPLSEINIQKTLNNNLAYPREEEVSLRNNGKGAKFIKASKLYDSN